MFTIDQIKAAQDRPREWVAIPEWKPADEQYDATKHGVYVGTMSAGERDYWEQMIYSKRGKNQKDNELQLRAVTAVCAVQDADGNKLLLPSAAKACRPSRRRRLSPVAVPRWQAA